MLTLLILACAPSSDIVTDDPPPCDFGYERGEDGNCYEVDDGTPPADTDTDVDTDTDTQVDNDLDDDGYASDVDCDDTNPMMHPEAAESCNELDDDCDGSVDEMVTTTWYEDLDGDGNGNDAVTVDSCSAVDGYSTVGGDCDDGEETVYPGAPDDQGDELDNDCDGEVDEDWDPCSMAYGWVDWTSAGGTWSTDWTGEHAGWPFDGTATVCDFSCNDWWLTAVGIGASDTCATMETLPYDLSGSTRVCFGIDDPGSESWGTCEVYTSGGTLTLTVHFQG